CVDEADRQPVGVRVPLHVQHTGDEDVAQVLMQRLDGVDGGDVARQPFGDLAGVERPPEQRLQPAARAEHRTPPATCARDRTTVSAVKNLRAKSASVALKSTKVIPSSTARPSSCSKTGECEASNGSRRYTSPGITTRMGGG